MAKLKTEIKEKKLSDEIEDFFYSEIIKACNLESNYESIFSDILNKLKNELDENSFNEWILNIFNMKIDYYDYHNSIDKLFYYIVDNDYEKIVLELFSKKYYFYAFNKLLYCSKLYKYILKVKNSYLKEYIIDEEANLNIVNYILINKNDEEFFKYLSDYFLKIKFPFAKYLPYYILLHIRNYSFKYQFAKKLLTFIDSSRNPYLYYNENVFFYFFALNEIYVKEKTVEKYLENSLCVNTYDLEHELLLSLTDKNMFKHLLLNSNKYLHPSFIYFFSDEINKIKDEQILNKINSIIRSNLGLITNDFNFLLALFSTLKYNYYISYKTVEKNTDMFFEETNANFFLTYLDYKKINVFDEKEEK